ATTFIHDQFGNPVALQRSTGEIEARYIGKSGKTYEQPSERDRTYSAGGRLQKTRSKNSKDTQWAYDSDGNLISRIDHNGTWKYEWNHAGLLVGVTRPDGNVLEFSYDALGRRKTKKIN